MSKELPATGTERGEPMFRLNVESLLSAASRAGDRTGYAISRTAGIAESSVYRILSGAAQPDLNTAMRLAVAYRVTVEELMDRVDLAAAA
ncbi:helix-turn-helix domain-containing protein [Streptomyces sp. NPDC058657]|uniref:helix-turn-helix domain-containing protein n=1 Tax=unclassified Streptomyces TaxID=2593676 RepID=UPI003653CC32